ncbi:MAG TPA: glycosyltransferase [Sporichthyaceae bacterium]|jgi:cellulose synthase (UDP-forming)|nr:glycosyltransferase [Sporichthyaceae bacterium]
MSRAESREVHPYELLPQPPTDAEKYAYLGRRHRWFAFYTLGALGLTVAAIIRLTFMGGVTRLLWPLAALMFTWALVSFVSTCRGRRMNLPDHLAKVTGWRPAGAYPSVDVYLPSCGEPMSVLRNTYRAVGQLEWAGELNVWVLDDSARPEVARMANEFGFHYRTRPNRGYMKKAGNLIFGYGQSAGDLILVLDADFAPRPDMLNEMVPYFDDETIGILQSPQHFDAHPAMPWIQRASGVEQRMFYRLIQTSRDTVDGAICVGTCAIYRRAALENSEGFAQIGHSEDVHTGVNLIRAGYKVRYLPVILAKGLCPETFSGYVNMMYRWCTGSLSLLADPRFHATPMRRAQRACYWSGFLFYVMTAVTVAFGSVPAIIVLWFYPSHVHPLNSLSLIPSFFGALFVLPALLGTRRVMDLLRLRIVYAYCFAQAVVDFARGRSAGWVPSGVKTRTPLGDKVRRKIVWWGGTMQAITWVGIYRGVLVHGLGQYSLMVTVNALSLLVWLAVAQPGSGLPESPAEALVAQIPAQRTDSLPAPVDALASRD